MSQQSRTSLMNPWQPGGVGYLNAFAKVTDGYKNDVVPVFILKDHLVILEIKMKHKSMTAAFRHKACVRILTARMAVRREGGHQRRKKGRKKKNIKMLVADGGVNGSFWVGDNISFVFLDLKPGSEKDYWSLWIQPSKSHYCQHKKVNDTVRVYLRNCKEM